MSSLLNTELACTSAPDKVLHVFYQDEHSKVREARSPNDGQSWILQDPIISQDAAPTGSAMTCYYVEKDADFGEHPTIHLLYINEQKQLAERVKRMQGQNPVWEDAKIPEEIKKLPVEYSKLAGEAFNQNTGWNPNGSQWAYFFAQKEGNMCLVEIRRTPKDPWRVENVMTQKPADVLLGTSLACDIADRNIKIFFQDHSGHICLREHRDGKWQDPTKFVKEETVQISTPLACTMTKDKSVHLFYIENSKEGALIVHNKDGKRQESLGRYYPGSKLGATSDENNITLFFRKLNAPYHEIGSLLFENGKWKQGPDVVPPKEHRGGQ